MVMEWVNFMIRDFLSRRRESEKIGVICGDLVYSYKKWHQQSEKLSSEVLNNQHGKIVGLFLPNGIAYAVSYFACLYSDKVIAPFHTGSTMDELWHTIDHCSISILITTEAYLSFIEKIVHLNHICMNIVVVDECGHLQKTLALYTDSASVEQPDIAELNDVVVLLHTSGTTSRPKRVMLTNQGLISNARAHNESLALCEKDVCLIQLPMMFGYCNTAQFIAHVLLGACIVINPNPFLVGDFYRIVEKWGITNFTAVPSILFALYHNDCLAFDISSLKIICFGGNPISKNHLQGIINKFPSVSFVQTYGLTEAGPRITTLPPRCATEKVGSVGREISGVTVKIINSLGNLVEQGETGEIVIQSEGMMKGYFRCAAETAAVIRDGWLHTGDIGYFTEDGYLYIVGREKNIIISGGQNISPEEVEEVLLTCPGVAAAKAYGVGDTMLGEVVQADIVVDFEHNDSSDIVHSLKLICSEKLSRYKIPKSFHIVDSISRTYNGKIKR